MTMLSGFFDLDALPALLRRGGGAAERRARVRELSLRSRAPETDEAPQREPESADPRRIEEPPAEPVPPAPRPVPMPRGDDRPPKPPLRHIQMRSHIGP